MKSLPLLCLLPGLFILAPAATSATNYLANSIQALQISAGVNYQNVYDITHDGFIGLEDAVYGLHLAANGGPLPVSKPTLRFNLPGSWDEDWFASTAVYDLDNDGKMEIIGSRHSVIYVWNNTGTLKWSAPVGQNGSASSTITHGSDRQYASPAVGDLDGDGKGEIAIAYSNKVAIYEDNGNLKDGWPQSFPNSTSEIRSIAAADLDGDKIKEILAVKTSSGPVTMVWNINGSGRTGWPQVQNCDSCTDFGGYNQNIGAADLTGDRVPEVISTYDCSYIGFNYANGSPLPANAVFAGTYISSVPMFHDLALAIQGWGANLNDRDEFTDSPPVFTDLDRDGKAEVIVYSDHERAGEYINRGNCLWVLNEDLTRMSGFDTPICSGEPIFTGYEDNIVQVAPAPALADLAGDPRLEIIVPSYDGYMRAYSAEGTLLWRYQFDIPGPPFNGASGAAASDLNDDGIPEIVFSTYSTTDNVSHLIVLDAWGQVLHKVPLLKRGSMSVPTLADIDGDDTLEIIVSLKDRIDYTYGGVQVYDVQTARKGYQPWPTGRGNLDRDGQPAM